MLDIDEAVRRDHCLLMAQTELLAGRLDMDGVLPRAAEYAEFVMHGRVPAPAGPAEAKVEEGPPSYRKKPIVIEAFQVTAEIAQNYGAAPFWFVDAVVMRQVKPIGYTPKSLPVFHIETLEGTMAAKIGDWIVRGVKGELYPVRHDIFAETYEPVHGNPPNRVLP